VIFCDALATSWEKLTRVLYALVQKKYPFRQTLGKDKRYLLDLEDLIKGRVRDLQFFLSHIIAFTGGLNHNLFSPSKVRAVTELEAVCCLCSIDRPNVNCGASGMLDSFYNQPRSCIQ
jgi:hypothetical protein